MGRTSAIVWPRFGVVVLLLVLAAALTWGQDQPENQQPDQQDTTSTSDLALGPPGPPGGGEIGPDYRIGPEDVLNIDVLNVPELKETVRVENDGTIPVKLLGHVKAVGLTTQELRRELEAEWGKTYLENPHVTVFVREFHARPVSVIGAVEKPGLYQLSGPRTLIEVLSMAGGLARKINGSAGRTLLVTRKGGFQDVEPTDGMRQVAPDQLQIDIRKLLYSHNTALNIQIKPFDTIAVSKAGIVYVVGEVKKQAGFTLEDRDQITVLEALALAEGLNPTAALKAARIIHRSPNGTLTETPIDLSRVMSGKAPDVELAANDVLYVPKSHGKVVAFRSTDSVIATLTGLIVFRGL
jgi:polysaccharide export outer membrane protein